MKMFSLNKSFAAENTHSQTAKDPELRWNFRRNNE
jgi:hypothetical protein